MPGLEIEQQPIMSIAALRSARHSSFGGRLREEQELCTGEREGVPGIGKEQSGRLGSMDINWGCCLLFKIKLYCNAATLICLCTSCGCFLTAKSDWSSCDRQTAVAQPARHKIITIWFFRAKYIGRYFKTNS